VNTLAFFDLDGTLTRSDTMLSFLHMLKGQVAGGLLLGSVLPAWCGAKLGLCPEDLAKRQLVQRAFGGQATEPLEAAATRFTAEVMPGLLRPAAMERLAWHQANGHQVVIVTASCSLWVAPWCRAQGLQLMATEMEVSGGTYTGRLSTPNCKGEEKVRRIKAEWPDLSGMEVHAYGDTPGDRPMLGLAGLPHYKPFR
jgi:phosphatidylglycerophosphatase C